MHKEQFKKKNIGNRVLLEPNALPWDNSKKSYDDIWTIEDYLDNGVRIKNSRTDHNKLLGFDHISKYRTDSSKDYDGHTHGVLVLNVQLYLNDREVIIKEKSHGSNEIPHSVTWKAYFMPLGFRNGFKCRGF